MNFEAKTAKELLNKYNQKKTKSKKGFSVSLNEDLFKKLEYLSKKTNTSKNEIIHNALIVFGLDKIEIIEEKEDNK